MNRGLDNGQEEGELLHTKLYNKLDLNADDITTTLSANEQIIESIDSNEIHKENIILKNYYPLEQNLKRKTRKMEWLLRTTNQIITFPNDIDGRNTDTDESINETQEKILGYPDGKLSTTLLTKIPTLMNMWMKRCSIDNSNAAFVVERLLQRLIDERKAGNEYFVNEEEKMITTDLYNIVIEAWTRTSGQVVKNNLQLLDLSPLYTIDLQQNDEPNQNQDRFVQKLNSENTNNKFLLGVPYPNTPTCIPFAPTRAHDVLNKMEEMANDDLNIRPDTKTYSLVLRAWVRSRDYCSLTNMEQILDRLEEIGSNNDKPQYHDVQPTVQCFNLYLYALANSQDSQSHKKSHAEKAHAILLDLKRRYNDDPIKNGNLMPCVNTYNQVLSAYARTRCKQGALNAQSILDGMMREANVTNVHPDRDTFNAVMGCWHRSGSENASFQIEYLLNLMNGLSESVAGYHRARPDHYSVNTVIASIAKSNRKEKLRRINYMLSNMERLYNVKADTLSYNLVIDAYAKSQDLRAVNETQRLLSVMENKFIEGNEFVMPDSFSYTTVIDTLSSKLKMNAGKKAELIVRRMESMCKEHGGKQPGTAVYNALMNCYASRGDKSDLNRLEAILRFMEGMSQKDGMAQMMPNVISYNTLLKGYAQSKENLTRKAEILLERMENGEINVCPDVVSYTTVITAFARSSIPAKARNAKRILDKMIDSYASGNNSKLEPTIFPFNACLNACAFTFNRSEKVNAFVVVVDTLVLIQKYCKADYITYGTILSCWRNLIPKHDDRRQAVVRSSFKQCCKDGLVGGMVLRQLQLTASPELYQELIGGHSNGNINSIPQKWSRNIQSQKRST